MSNLLILAPLIMLLVAEYVGDFLLQDREMAVNKSKHIPTLLLHLLAIFICIAATGLGFGWASVYVAGCYIVVHGIQDWFIWNGYKWSVGKRLKKEAKEDLGTIGSEGRPWYNEEERLERITKAYIGNNEYVDDKVFWDTVGLDRLLHIITLIILWGVFFL